MILTQLITHVIVWERRLEFEKEKPKNHFPEPYMNYLAAPQTCRKNDDLAYRIFRHRKVSQASADLRKALHTNLSTW
jgi:hypothetical protein